MSEFYYCSRMFVVNRDFCMKKSKYIENVCYDGLNSIPEVLEACMKKYSNLHAIVDDYNKIDLTYEELRNKIANIASGLQSIGVKKGDKIGLFSESHGLWLAVSISILKCGAVDVIRGSNAPVDELEYITQHSDCKGLVLRDVKLYNSLKPYLLNWILASLVWVELQTILTLN